jgi:hypothetical protein
LSGAKEDQTSLAAGRAVRPAKHARYVSRVEKAPEAENFQEKELNHGIDR